MKAFTRTSKMTGKEGKAAWEKGLKNFLTQNGLTVPEDYVWDEISCCEVTDVSLTTMGDDDEVGIMVSGYSSGEPKAQLYDTGWNLVGEMSEATEFEWEYYIDQTAPTMEEAGADSSVTTVSVPTPVTVNHDEANNNAVEEEKKEEKTMAIKTMEMKELMELARVTKITKLQDAEYVNKELMVKLAAANGMPTNRKTTRAQALEFISNAGNARYAELKKAAAPAKEAPKAQEQKQDKVTEAQRKTVAFMRKMLNYASDNQKKGHGHTISGEYLKYFIFEVQFGVKKFKAYAQKAGNTPEFAEQMKQAQAVAKWAIDKEYIVPVTYKVSFDFGGKHFERCCYKQEFDGSDETKGKMFPIEKCVFAGAQNVKWVATTYTVTEKADAWR